MVKVAQTHANPLRVEVSQLAGMEKGGDKACEEPDCEGSCRIVMQVG